MKKLVSLLIFGLMAGIIGSFINLVYAQTPIPCERKMWVDEIVWEGPEYNACNSEMKTTFDWNTTTPGWYDVILCRVFNTPYYVEYWAGELPGNYGSQVEWTHCDNLLNHHLLMDVRVRITNPDTRGFVPPWKLTAEYFASKPY